MSETKFVTVPGDYEDVWAALGVERPSDEELAAARKAVKSLKKRRHESVDEWARVLGKQFGGMTD